jgi:hypothetical protein
LIGGPAINWDVIEKQRQLEKKEFADRWLRMTVEQRLMHDAFETAIWTIATLPLGEIRLFQGNRQVLGRSANRLKYECPAPAARRTLPGHTEWVPDPRRAGTATRELPALEATYTRETGLKPDLARRRPLGETRDAGFDPKTGEIFVYEDVPPAFRHGYLAEELHHYQQVRDAGHLGKSLAEIEKIDPGFAVRMEADVLGRVRGSGFIPYDPRHYAPYTDVPRPPGVAGDTAR